MPLRLVVFRLILKHYTDTLKAGQRHGPCEPDKRITYLRTFRFEPINPALPPCAAAEVTVSSILSPGHRAVHIHTD